MIVKLSDSEFLTLPHYLVTPTCKSVFAYWSSLKMRDRPPSFSAFESRKELIETNLPRLGMVSILKERIIINYWGSMLLDWFGEGYVNGLSMLAEEKPSCLMTELFLEASQTQKANHISLHGDCANLPGLFEGVFLPVDIMHTEEKISPFVVCAFGYIGEQDRQS